MSARFMTDDLSVAARQRWTLVAASIALNITILDETVVFLALPAMNRELGLNLSGQEWVVNGYLVSLAALLLLGGSLADLFGRRRMFIYGLGAFGLASLACGLAPSGGALIAFRLVQGGAAAMAMPSTLALVTASFHGEDRGAAIGSWASWGAVAAAIGPLVGGLLIASWSWRSIFFLGLPLVAAAMGIAAWAVTESRDEEMSVHRIDVGGAVLAALALGGLSFALIEGATAGWGNAGVLLALTSVPVSAAGFLLHEARAEAPLLPLGLFCSRNFSAANGATLALYAVFNGNFFILTIYLQTVLGYSPLAAGAATLPVTLLMIVLAPRTGRLAERVGPRFPMGAGMLLTAAGLSLLAFVRPGDAYWFHILPGVVVFGLGLAATVPPLTTTAVSAVSDPQAGIASAVNDEAARAGALLGVALCGAVFATVFQLSLEKPDSARAPERAEAIQLAREHPSAALQIAIPETVRDQVLPELRVATVEAYQGAMAAGVLLALIGALVSVLGIENHAVRSVEERLPPN